MTGVTLFRALLFCMAFVGCSDPAPKNLGNGYMYARTNGENNYIIKDNKPVVDTFITQFEVKGSYVFGSRVASDNPDVEAEFISQRYGYFILDLKTGELRESLSEEEYSALRAEAENAGLKGVDSQSDSSVIN